MICLVFMATMIAVKLLHYNVFYKINCILFKVTYCSCQVDTWEVENFLG